MSHLVGTMSTVTERPGVYAIRNIVNGKVYIGSASNISKRWSRHRKDLRSNEHRNRHLQAAWNLYGEDSFEFIIIELTDRLTEREQHWMDITGCCDRFRGYNDAPFARTTRGRAGKTWTPEERAHLSKVMRGRAGAGITAPVRYGEDNWGAKLTWAKVREIRARYGPRRPFGRGKRHGGLTYARLAAEYGVTLSVICEIIKGTAWRENRNSSSQSATGALGKAKAPPSGASLQSCDSVDAILPASSATQSSLGTGDSSILRQNFTSSVPKRPWPSSTQLVLPW